MKVFFDNGSETFFEENKMLVCDELDNMIVALTTIMNSHERPEYRTGRFCARVAQVSSKKRKKAIFV